MPIITNEWLKYFYKLMGITVPVYRKRYRLKGFGGWVPYDNKYL